MVWPVIMAVARTYAPYVIWPVAAVIGVIGYNFEKLVGHKESPYKVDSIQEERLERTLEHMTPAEATEVPTLKSKQGIPRTVLDRNDKSRLLHRDTDNKNV